MLNGALPTNAHPSTSGSPSAQAPGKVSIHVDEERDPIVLPREMVDAPRAHDQIPRQPDQRCPIGRGGGRPFAAGLLSREPQ
eukprot:14684212-Alexandrium_andersonii.AAC.1